MFVLLAVALLSPIMVYGTFPFHGISIIVLVSAIFVLISAARAGSILFMFNVSYLFLVVYPFYVQSIVGLNLSGFGVELLRVHPSVIFISITFILATNVAYLLKTPLTKPVRMIHYSNPKDFRSIAFAASCVVLYLAIFGVDGIVLSRFEQARLATETTGPLAFLTSVLKVTPACVLFLLARQRLWCGKPYLGSSTIILALITLVICNPYNSARLLALSAIIIAIFPIFPKKLVNWLPTLFPALMIFVLPVTSVMRYGFDRVTIDNVLSIFQSIEFSSMQVLNDAFYIIDTRSYNFGTNLLSAILVFLPRSIWPEKNTGTGIMLAEAAHYPFLNIGVPSFTDAYLDFGIIGVAAMATFLGIAFNQLQSDFDRGSSTGKDLFVIVFALIPLLCRGDLSTFFITFYAFLLSYFVSRFVMGKRERFSNTVGKLNISA